MKTANIRLPEAFGDRISFLRKLKGLTQAQLAEKLGISAQAVSKWESGVSQTKRY
ncbi:helix-turn-helix domain-containing protein [Blautia sp. OF01-4LB]|uniref:helix-turn-helix domain-containing protein n=1 Tax=Blautia sp. OF01-4LB TaxID=2292286 RepID=UPI000E483BC9|nr:helix-turn-helix transcriptional regulator [Blautia sp. OF01-4LB]RHP75140.1 XRE family transcriptional regulator [Blautia sp. OF01-4LB]